MSAAGGKWISRYFAGNAFIFALFFFCCVAYMNSPVSGDGSLMIIGPEHTQIEADPGNG